MIMPNPLLDTPALVDYSAVTLEHLSDAVDQVIAAHRDGIAGLVDRQRQLPTWDDLVLGVDVLDANLQAVFYAIAPLAFQGGEWESAVHEAYARVTTRFRQKLNDSELFTLYERLANSSLGQHLDAHQRTTLRLTLQAFRLAGVHLDPAVQQRIEQIEQRIRGLEEQFARNLARSIEQSSIHVTQRQRLAGIPERLLAQLAASASAASLPGWLVTCDEASSRAVLEYASDRALREQVYRAYQTRGWSADAEHDNGPVLERLAQARHEKASLLGFPNHLMFSLQSKSAGSAEQVRGFLDDLARKLRTPLQAWQQRLRLSAHDAGLDDVQPWDIAYLRDTSSISDEAPAVEAYAEYFTLDNVMQALVSLAQQLFGLALLRTEVVAAWHPSVLTFEVLQDHARIGHLYVDALQWPGKQGGNVFTSYIRNRRIDAEGQYHGAVAAVFSDVLPGTDGKPAVLDHLALRKLYHEFGHALHHLMVRTASHVLSDLRHIGTDGVEVSGKLLERWVWDAGYMASISSHYQSGVSLAPQELEGVLATLRGEGAHECAILLSQALFDLDLHSAPNDGRTIEQRVEDSRRQASCMPMAGFERPMHAFEHLLSGYDAGYYAYLWSDVQAFDLFSRFEQHGLLDARTGRDLQEAVFAPGSSRPLVQGIEAFLGRPVSALPYLRWLGLPEIGSA
jgi:oligopeptidase A